MPDIYRPPRKNYSNASICLFLDPFTDIFNKLSKEHSTLITGGDFNLNLLELTHREKFQEYLDLFLSNGSIPQITLPTRFSRRKATLIDQIFCRFTKNSSHKSSGVIVTKISDHLPCFSIINYSNTANIKKPRYIKIQRKGTEAMNTFNSEVKEGLKNTPFDHNPLADPTMNYVKLETILKEARSKAFPIKEVKFNQKKHRLKPWITFDVLKAINLRDKLYIKWKQTSPISPNYAIRESEFKECRSSVQKTIRAAKVEYYNKSFENYKSDMKKTWNKINEILSNKSKKDEFPNYFLDGNKILTKDIDIANCFNNFFCNIGPELANSIKSPLNKSYSDYLKQNILSSFHFDTVTPEFTLKLIQKLKSKSSFGHDGLSSIMLKYISKIIINILTTIINQSLLTGIFPDSLKLAKIAPIYKKEERHIADNYRPISLLPVLSKIFEKVVFIQVYKYFVDNDLLYKGQYGFRKLHSTELAALEFTDKIITHLDQGKLPLAIFLDLSKAFDTIDHSILLKKLHYYGVCGTALNWFKSYLSNRKQYVQFNDSVSSLQTITTGVPQGSILGPLLFIIYMNDIVQITSNFHFTLYADDTSLVEPICTFTANTQNGSNYEISETINNELKLIMDWLCLNKLSLNAKKTKMMIFHNRQRNISHLILKLYINDTRIECVKEFNFLGTVLDEHMTWNSHTQKISSRIACVVGTLNRLKRFLPSEILKMIYNALIVPHLNFGLLLWGNNIKRVFRLQKMALRAITTSKYNAHTSPLFIKLKLLKIHDMYKLNMLKFYFKYKKDKLPKYFNGMFDNIYPTHIYDTRQKDKPIEPRWELLAAKRSIRYALPLALSITPVSIIDKIKEVSLQTFSRHIKQIYIDLYDPLCHISDCYICNRDA